MPSAASDTLRFKEQAGFPAFLAAAGFADIVLLGDWDGSPVGPGSPERIAIAS